jgi:MFS family permease
MENNDFEYKNSYTAIFSLNYFTQGIYTSIFTMVLPVYILTTYGTINSAALAFMLSIILFPAAIKIFYGIATDKTTIGKLGRRKPWIISASVLTGLIWIIISFMIPSTADAAIRLFTIAGIIISFGIYISDTALDGFILDICPKSQLGRTQGFCWGLRAIGIITGGPIILLFLLFLPLQFILIVLGILMIIFPMLTLKIEDIETPNPEGLGRTLKTIFKDSENWKMFFYSFFMQIVGGVVYTFLALYILVRAGYINPEGANLSSVDISLYQPQALITLFISIGIIVGAILGGIVADKISRRTAVYSSMGLNTISLLLLLLPAPLPALIFFAFLVGLASGWIFSSFVAVAGEYSQQYPEFDSTYFSICISFINFGTLLGMVLTGITFNVLSGITSDTLLIFGTVFIVMIILESIALIPFMMLNKEIYEYKLAKDKIVKV